MAKNKTRMSNAEFVTFGYGQVEPNHLSAPRNGQVYAQLPAAADIEILEQGQFVKYDYAAGVCDFSAEPAAGVWMMVYNEVKNYEPRETEADFAMIRDNYGAHVYSPVGQDENGYILPELMPEGTKMVPRVFYISVGDHWTTNTIKAAAGSLKKGDLLKIDPADGLLIAGEAEGGDLDPKFAVAQVYTMPDNQPGVKVIRVA